MNILTNLNLEENEIQNAVVHPLSSAPSSPKAGQIYYNSTDKLLYYYNNTKWVPVGIVYSQGSSTGVVITGLDTTGKVTTNNVVNLTLTGYSPVTSGVVKNNMTLQQAIAALDNAIKGSAGSGDGKRYADIVIGTSTNGWTEADCDYLCDGENDDEEFQQAVNRLEDTGGKIVILTGGYLFGNTVKIAGTHIDIMGEGVTVGFNEITDDEIFSISGSYISISDIEFYGISDKEIAINADTSAPVVIQNCNFISLLNGIVLRNGNNSIICGNKFFNSNIITGSVGITLNYCTYCIVANNVFSDVPTPFNFDYSDNCSVIGNSGNADIADPGESIAFVANTFDNNTNYMNMGQLKNVGEPTDSNDAATKDYVDTNLAKKVSKQNVLASGTNLDTVTESGFYYAQSPKNGPDGIAGNGELLVICGTQNAIIAQVYFYGINSNKTYVRNGIRSAGGVINTWQNWTELATTANNYSNQNLLDNWYFGNPVNQRTLDKYTGEWVYTIDRWQISAGTLTVGDDVSPSGGYMFQPLESSLLGDLQGKQVAISVLHGSNELSTATATVPETWGSWDDIASASGIALVGTNDGSALWLVLRDITNIKAVKLELGDTQTLAHKDADGSWVLNEIPDYGEQLLRCQRFFHVYGTTTARPTNMYDCVPQMIKTPTQTTITTASGMTLYANSANI